MDYAMCDDTGNNIPYRMLKSLSYSNPTLNRQPNVQVEYELSLPIDVSTRHQPYSSLWNLNQRCFKQTSFLFFLKLEPLSKDFQLRSYKELNIANCNRDII